MLQDSQLNNRSIRTFVRRSARMTSFQKTSYQNLYSIWCINYIDLCNNKDSYKTKSALQDTFSLSSIFGNDNPVICEVGFGSGDATYEIAKENSQNNYLCIEVFKAGIASLLGKIDEHNLNNIKIVEVFWKILFPTLLFLLFISFFLIHGKRKNITKGVL